MKLQETGIEGCFLAQKAVFEDKHGSFHRAFQKSILDESGVGFAIREVLVSTSARNVLRGLHYQAAPRSTTKLVVCISGEIFDAVVDLRKNSPSYLKTFTVRLSEDEDTMIYIPEGVAHGFYTLRDSTILYLTSGVFSAAHDSGILWNSAGIEWPTDDPIVSERDRNLIPLHEYAAQQV
jgi:dTDP-4-dehydrorhamnose 3,5-epimerase